MEASLTVRRKAAAFCATLAMALALSVGAAGSAWAATDTLTVTGDTDNSDVVLSKNMIMPVGQAMPNTSFAFMLTPCGTDDLPAVKPAGSAAENAQGYYRVGVAPTTGSVTVTFAAGDTVTIGLPAKVPSALGVSPTATDYQYKTTNGTISLAGATFNEPGIYRYILAETENTYPGMVSDQTTYFVDVNVGHGNIDGSADTGDLAILGYTCWTVTTDTGADVAAIGKTTGFNNTVFDTTAGLPFSNTVLTSNLTFAKTVTGVMGDRQKDFAITTTLAGAGATATYVVSYYDATGTKMTGTLPGPATITTDADGAASFDANLKNGYRAVVENLPRSATTTYNVKENDYTADGYVTTTGSAKYAGTTYSAATINTVAYVAANGVDGNMLADTTTAANVNSSVGFTNDKNTVTPTGLFFTYWPFIVGAIVVIAAAVVFFKLRRKPADDDDFSW